MIPFKCESSIRCPAKGGYGWKRIRSVLISCGRNATRSSRPCPTRRVPLFSSISVSQASAARGSAGAHPGSPRPTAAAPEPTRAARGPLRQCHGPPGQPEAHSASRRARRIGDFFQSYLAQHGTMRYTIHPWKQAIGSHKREKASLNSASSLSSPNASDTATTSSSSSSSRTPS